MDLSEEEVRKILGAASDAVTTAIDLFRNEGQWKDRRGGYLCVADPETGNSLLQARIGDPPAEKWVKYFDLSAEKADWLGVNPEALSSFEGRDSEGGKPGGAIRTKRFILSFSGLPEKGDEAVVLVMAIKLGYLSYQHDKKMIEKIVLASGNPYFCRLASKVCFSELYVAQNVSVG